MNPGAIVFAGGGSGGHIFPALAIHEELQRLTGGATRDVFVCSKRPLDSKILTREGVEFLAAPAQPISMRPRGLLRFMRGWGPSVRLGRKLIRELRDKGEVQVVAMGGFVAAPIAQAAIRERVTVMLVNMDAVPGKANRLIARRVPKVISCIAVTGPCAQFQWPVVPPIVRPSALTPKSPQECRSGFGLDPGARTLLITGGSQGAITLNRTVLRTAKDFRAAFDGWQIIHQTGKSEDSAARAAYSELGIRAIVEPFFEQMGEAWRASDLALSRAGAGGIADAWAYQIPTLFMPNPYHKDQHQKHNAARLVASGAAVMVDDLIDEDANARLAGAALIEHMRDHAARASMRDALARLGPADGAVRIARMLLDH